MTIRAVWAVAAMTLATSKSKSLFSVLDQNVTRFHTYVSQRADIHCHDERLAWVPLGVQGTSSSGSFVSKLLELQGC